MEKLMDLVHYMVKLEKFHGKCSHEKRWFRIPWSGEWIWAAHPPLKGRQCAVLADEWSPVMLR